MDCFAVLCRDTRKWLTKPDAKEVDDACDADMFPTWQAAARFCPNDGKAYAVVEFHCTMQNGTMHD